MVSNNNIFCVSNPDRILDGLWRIISESGLNLSDMLIFVPSRRAVRSVEKMIVARVGHATFLPKIVPLGEGFEVESDTETPSDVISITERIVVTSYLLSKFPEVGSIANALPIAHSLITMQDYLENSRIDISTVDWRALVDDKYAAHFQTKAAMLELMSNVTREIFANRETETVNRNKSVAEWGNYIKSLPTDKSLVIVCGSTASVPVTRDLMRSIAMLSNGRIILSGKISGDKNDFELDTNPYHSEYEFLSELGMTQNDVIQIDVGKSNIDFMNVAFGNTVQENNDVKLENCHLIECNNEAQEAASVAEIAARAVRDNKTVLVITPDAAGNSRLKQEFVRRNIVADFSGATPGTTTSVARAILNLFDGWIEAGDSIFLELYAATNFNLFDTLAEIIERFYNEMKPEFAIDDDVSVQIWGAVRELSDCLNKMQIRLSLTDARAMLNDCFAGVGVRQKMNDTAPVVVLGTIESRMQSADVIILMGLNEGMFPALGYENPWLPRDLAAKVGVPSPNHKVSLMALDFMNLSCGKSVYWTRCGVSGGVQTQESRFLSRVIVARGQIDKEKGTDILRVVNARDNVPFVPLDYTAPTPPNNWHSLHVTDLENLIHNPYVFYVKHILRLRPQKDYWIGPDVRDFGILVHDVLEHANPNMSEQELVNQMDSMARKILGAENLIFSFWHKRFVEIAPVALDMLKQTPNALTENQGWVNIEKWYVGARADRVWNGGVLDIKTGKIPNDSQLEQGNMPQLPLEAYMLQCGGFPGLGQTEAPTMYFLQLQSGHVELKPFDVERTQTFINAAIAKTRELYNMFIVGGAPYEYRQTGDEKYKDCDDFARAAERD